MGGVPFKILMGRGGVGKRMLFLGRFWFVVGRHAAV